MNETAKTTPSYLPAMICALIVSLSMGVLFAVQIYQQKPLSLLNRTFLGMDYDAFYKASESLRAGMSPYEVSRYVTPPPPAVMNLPLTSVPFDQAAVLFGLLQLIFVLVAAALAVRAFSSFQSKERGAISLYMLMVIALSYPLYFLIDRGNIDGFIFLCVVAAVLLNERRPMLCGAFLALGVSCKLYPVLLLAPLVMGRRYRCIGWYALWQGILVALWPRYWLQFVNERLRWRVEEYVANTENGSIFYVMRFFGDLGESMAARVGMDLNLASMSDTFAFMAYLFLVAMTLYADAASRRLKGEAFIAMALLYVPFMIAIPKVVYHYEYVLLIGLIPVLCYLWRETETRQARQALVLMTVGLACTQMQAIGFQKLFSTEATHIVPGAGLVAVMVGALWYKLAALKLELERSVDADASPQEAAQT